MKEPSKAVQRMLDKAKRNAKAVIRQQMTNTKKAENDDYKHGVCGKPQGQPVNIHRGSFQRKDSDEDLKDTYRGIRPSHVFSIPSSIK